MTETLPQRRSIRLQNYDYSQAALYYVTLCTQGKVCLFGYISENEMKLNKAGRMIEQWYYKIESKFNDIICHDMIIMPNHTHFVLQNTGIVGADPCVCPENNTAGEHAGSPLHEIIQWFKTMTTNDYIKGVKENKWQPFNGKVWQRNYYEHIIRTMTDYNNIAKYILHNPSDWQGDNYYMEDKL